MTKNKLKTLKDIERDYYAFGINENIVPVPTLRQEAIKWVKDLRNKEMMVYTDNENLYLAYCMAEEKFIHFFNLTKEDLK
jgi:hypothetical protein